MNKIKNYFIRLWNALWASTDLDEKAEAALKEAKDRIVEMKKELKDVKNAAKELASQTKDVVKAAKGKKRRGRKTKRK
jgi:prefoldin subunit 5